MIRPRLLVALLVLVASFASGLSCAPPAHAPKSATTFAAPPREAESYATAPSPAVHTGDPVVQIAENAILDAARMRKLTLTADGRLTELAAWIATQRLHQMMPDGEAIDYAAGYLGLTGPAPQVVGVGFEDDASLASQLADRLATLPSNIVFRRYGRAVLSYGRANLAVVVVTTADLELSQPVPKRVHAGQVIHLTGNVVAPLTSVHSSVTAPDGSVQDSTEMPSAFDIPFTASVAGVHRVELLADGPDGPDVVANFPVYVDVDEPRAFTEAATTGDGGSASETAELLFRKLNESRAQAKLPPLERLDALAKIAKANSEDMAEHHFFAHVSPTTGDVGDRVKRAGLPLGMAGENIALGANANAMHQGLMGSPGHRGAILSKDFTHVGIGVVYEGDGTYVATEVFTRIARTLDLARAPADALTVVNVARANAKVGALTLDPALSDVAAAGARAYFEGLAKSHDQAMASATTVVTTRGRALQRQGEWAWLVVPVTDLEELSKADLLDGADKVLGLGFAQGPRGDLPNELVVVVIVER